MHWKEANTKGYPDEILYDILEKADLQGQKTDTWWPEAGGMHDD